MNDANASRVETLGAEDLEFEEFVRMREQPEESGVNPASEAAGGSGAEAPDEGEAGSGAGSDPDTDKQETKPPEGEGDPAPEKKRKSGAQRNAEKIERLATENQELRLRLERLEMSGGESPAGEPEAEPTGRPKLEDFDTVEEYTEALVDWKAAQREQASAEAAAAAKAKAAEHEAAEKWNEALAQARQAHPDFDDDIDPDAPMSPAMVSAILDSEKGGELAYWLGTHPEESARIAQLSPIGAVREIGRIEAGLAKAPETKQPVKRASSAPAAITPVTPSGKAAPRMGDPDLDHDDWERLRNEQLRHRAR